MQKLYLFLILGCMAYGCIAQITAPQQPGSGPGANNFIYSGVTLYDYGTNQNADGFWLFEPTGPTPDSANVVVFIHGWGETNLKFYGAMIDRIVRAGNIVICPRYEKTVDTNYGTYTDSCARGIQRALDTLKQPGHVKPRLYNYFILGHSMGGVLTANMTTRYAYYNLPKPLAAFSMQPGADIPELLLSDTEYAQFPADVKYLIAIGNDDAIVDSTAGKKLFYETTPVPTSHKNLVRHFADNHGSPALTATHYEPGSLSGNNIYDDGEVNIVTIVSTATPPDAVDFYCYWKLWDALVDCALNDHNCDIAFGDTPQQKFMGNWSDGTPVTPLLVIPSAASAAVNNIAGNFSVSVFPNPASENGFRLTVNPADDEAVIELFDINGRQVYRQKIQTSTTEIKCNLQAGLYLYQVSNPAHGTIARGKLIIP